MLELDTVCALWESFAPCRHVKIFLFSKHRDPTSTTLTWGISVLRDRNDKTRTIQYGRKNERIQCWWPKQLWFENVEYISSWHQSWLISWSSCWLPRRSSCWCTRRQESVQASGGSYTFKFSPLLLLKKYRDSKWESQFWFGLKG